jgi:riboflavin synthase
MFTGIIREVGRIQAVTNSGGIRLTIEAPQSTADLNVNDSISVNGVCQTVVECSGHAFSVHAVEETLRKTTLGELKAGDPVNLELPLRLSDRLGGHLVQGHVDGIGVVHSVLPEHSSHLISIELNKEFMRYVIPVGSIAIDGVSLTVARVSENRVTVAIIPHTMENTSFGRLKSGSRVNVELDLVGKYLERLLEPEGSRGTTVTWETLRRWGYET